MPLPPVRITLPDGTVLTTDQSKINHMLSQVLHREVTLEAAERSQDEVVELTSHFVAGTWAGAEWLMSGTHKGDLPGLPATNKKVSIRGASVLELQGNKLRRCSDYWDMATFLKQISVMPSD
jgi:steroid delta-isomerase-like uncharacterized protein